MDVVVLDWKAPPKQGPKDTSVLLGRSSCISGLFDLFGFLVSHAPAVRVVWLWNPFQRPRSSDTTKKPSGLGAGRVCSFVVLASRTLFLDIFAMDTALKASSGGSRRRPRRLLHGALAKTLFLAAKRKPLQSPQQSQILPWSVSHLFRRTPKFREPPICTKQSRFP